MSKILLIDDNRNNLILLEVLLKKSFRDYKILTEQSGRKGIEIAKKELPDAIILDIRMPDMYGYEVCKHLQSDESTRYIPVLLLTAYQSDSKYVIRGLEFGALSFLTKPIDNYILIAHVNVALRIAKTEKALLESERKMYSLLAESKHAEEVLMANRDYLEKLTNSMWDAVFSIKMPERVIEWANDSFRLIGYKPSEYIGKDTAFLYADKDEFLDFGNKLKDAMAAGKDVLHTDQLLKRKSGENFPAEIIVTFHRENDEVVSVTSIVRDITGRKRAEQELSKERTLLKAIIDNIPVLLTRYDPDTNMLYLNKEFEKIVGWKTEEVKDIDLMEKVYPDPDYREQAKEYMQKASTGWREFRVQSKSGKIINSEWSNIRLDDETQIGIGIDITDRKIAEQKLLESEKKYRYLSNELERILNLMPGIIAYKDTENNFIRVNKYFADAQNLTKEEMEGRSCFDLYPKDQAQAYWDDDLEVINSRKPKLNIEELWESAEGTKWVSASKIPYIDENGEVKGVLVVAIDITQRKQAEEELMKKMNDLERFNRLTVDRELRMIELKKEINELREKAGMEKKYRVVSKEKIEAKVEKKKKMVSGRGGEKAKG